MLMTACGNNQQELVIGDPVFVGEQTMTEVAEPATPNCPPYVVVNNPEVELASFPVDKDGYHVLFNGNEKLQGWRGYGKDHRYAGGSADQCGVNKIKKIPGKPGIFFCVISLRSQPLQQRALQQLPQRRALPQPAHQQELPQLLPRSPR